MNQKVVGGLAVLFAMLTLVLWAFSFGYRAGLIGLALFFLIFAWCQQPEEKK